MQKAAAKVETVTLKDLAATMAEAHSLPKGQVNTMLTEMVASLGKHLKKGSRIRISGLGILQVRKRAARMGLGRVTTRSGPLERGRAGSIWPESANLRNLFL
jgi:DNA-binding protein HU-beta